MDSSIVDVFRQRCGSSSTGSRDPDDDRGGDDGCDVALPAAAPAGPAELAGAAARLLAGMREVVLDLGQVHRSRRGMSAC